MAASTTSKVTTDHEEIRRWALERSGKPAAPIHLKSEGNGNGLISIHLPDNRGKNSLAEISWEDWFEKFDAAKLAFLYQELTPGGQKSNFNQVVSREAVDEVESAVGGKGRSASRRGSRRSPEVSAIASLRDGKSNSDAQHSAGPRRASKKPVATMARVGPRKKQLPIGKRSRDKNS